MQTIDSSPTVYRMVDLRAAAEAAAALRAAADGTPLLAAADEVLTGGSDAARDRLRDAVLSPEFLPRLGRWMRELREAASAWPDSGACTAATALKLWSWTLEHFRDGGGQLIDELAGVLCPLLAARCYILSAVVEPGGSRLDLSHVYAAHASAVAGAVCAELVFGYRQHSKWDAQGCAVCFASDQLDELEELFPGFAGAARMNIDVLEVDGTHPAKRGPCAQFDGLDVFMRLRNRLDACLTGARIAKDRAAAAIVGRG